MNRLEKWMVNRGATGKSGIKLARRLLEHIQPGSCRNVLDVGCGRGVISCFMAREYGMQVTGIDIDEDELGMAEKSRTGQTRFIKADARKLPFDDRSLDLVLAFGVLHHIPDWQKAAGEIGRVLKTGGYFVSAELVYPEWVTSIDERSTLKFGIYTLDTSRLSRLLQDEGFVTLHSAVKPRLLWTDYEAVFQKKFEKAFSRV